MSISRCTVDCNRTTFRPQGLRWVQNFLPLSTTHVIPLCDKDQKSFNQRFIANFNQSGLKVYTYLHQPDGCVRRAAIISRAPPSHYGWYGRTCCLKQCNQDHIILVPFDLSASTPQQYMAHAQVTAADVTNAIELGLTLIKLHIQDCVLIELSDGIRRVIMPMWPTNRLWWQ